MPRKPKTNTPMETIAFLPSGYVEPVIQDVPKPILNKWIQGIMNHDDLILRHCCLSGMYLLCIKNDFDESYNHFASELLLFRNRETVGGNCFLVRIENVTDGVPTLTGITPTDKLLVQYAAKKFFGKEKTSEH